MTTIANYDTNGPTRISHRVRRQGEVAFCRNSPMAARAEAAPLLFVLHQISPMSNPKPAHATCKYARTRSGSIVDLQAELLWPAEIRLFSFVMAAPVSTLLPPCRRRPRRSWLVVETPGTIFTMMNIMKVHALQSHATAVHFFRDIFRTLDIPRLQNQAYHTHNNWIILLIMCHSEIFNS